MNFKSYSVIILTNDIKSSDTINYFCSSALMKKRIEEEEDRRDEFMIARNPRVLFGLKKFFAANWEKV